MSDFEKKSQFRRRFIQERKKPQFRKRIATYRAIRAGQPRKHIPRTVMPSFFTLMNLFCGFLSVIQAHEGNFKAAAWLIVIAGLFDLFDGLVARMARATSIFGMELDSLSDVISFGLAPSFLVYLFGLNELKEVGLILASLPAICGAVRLARFNTDFEGEKKFYFEGLPIPAQAITIVSFILAFHDIDLTQWFQDGKLSVLVPLVVGLSVLMVSTIKFASVPKPSIASFKAKPALWIGYSICAILVLVLHGVGIFISLVLYLLVGIGYAIFRAFQSLWDRTDPEK